MYYHALLEPQLARARLRSERIFQHKTVPQIIELMLQRQGINRFEIKSLGEHQVRAFCVQAGETDLDFIARLAAEEALSTASSTRHNSTAWSLPIGCWRLALSAAARSGR